MKRNIDIILPCYNPNLGWEYVIVSKYKELESSWNELVFHLHIVNDGSVFGFKESSIEYLVKNISNLQVISYLKNKGKGFALREALKKCHSEMYLYTDYDFPYSLESISNVIATLLEGADIVIATRQKEYYNNLPLLRRVVSYLFRLCNRYLLRMKYPDTQAGLKGFSTLGKTILLSTNINTYLFDWEFIYRACKNSSIRITDLEVDLRENVIFSNLTLSCYFIEFISYWYNSFR